MVDHPNLVGGCLVETPPPPRTATAAGGTHPTGMHSCLGSCYVVRYHFICVKLRENVLTDFETGVWLTLNNGRSSESDVSNYSVTSFFVKFQLTFQDFRHV